jgi:hypothetical protein
LLWRLPLGCSSNLMFHTSSDQSIVYARAASFVVTHPNPQPRRHASIQTHSLVVTHPNQQPRRHASIQTRSLVLTHPNPQPRALATDLYEMQPTLQQRHATV